MFLKFLKFLKFLNFRMRTFPNFSKKNFEKFFEKKIIWQQKRKNGLTVRRSRVFYRFTGNGYLNENFNCLKTVNASDTKFCK